MKFFKVRKIFYIPILLTLLCSYAIAAISPNVDAHYVYKILPAFVVYSDNLGEECSATTKGIIVFIKPSYRGDKGTLDHELMHVKQGYRFGFQHWILLLWSENRHLQMECEAYALQITRETDIPMWADFIKKEYNFSAPVEDIKEYISVYWKEQHRR